MQTQTPDQRKADAKAKRTIARRMLKADKSNSEIVEAVKAKFKTGIGPDVMAAIRAELGTSGPNRGVKKAKLKKKHAQDNGTSSAFKGAVQGVVNQMKAERIQSLHIHADGSVRVQQNHDFFLTPQQGAA